MTPAPLQRRLLDPEGAPGSTDLEHVPVSLTTPPWGSRAAVHIQLFLALGDVGQHRTEPLVLDNGRLVDLLQPVKGAVGQVDAVMADRQTPIGVVENGHPLARQGPADRVRLKEEQDLVVLECHVERQARRRDSWRTSLPVAQQPRNPQPESIARSPYEPSLRVPWADTQCQISPFRPA